MTDFYSLDVDAQADCMRDLAATALGRWDGAYRDVELVKYRENAVFSVHDAGGRRFALRIHRHAYHTDAELLSELQWMESLEATGIIVPRIIPTSAGERFTIVSVPSIPEPRQVDMLSWLDGTQVGAVETLASPGGNADLVEVYRQAGIVAARLHDHSAAWTLPAGFVRHAWDEEGLLGENPFWGRFLDLAALDAQDVALIREACGKARAGLADFGRTERNYGLIHADLVPENLLRSPEGLMLIDFDDAGFGWHMFELATALYFHLDEPYYPDIRDALVEGYRSVRPLPEEDWARLPLFMLLRSLTYLGWVHTRHETQTAHELTPMLVERTRQVAKAYLDHG